MADLDRLAQTDWTSHFAMAQEGFDMRPARASDHTHGCRESGCNDEFTRCELDNETCLRRGSPNFGGLCDYHEDEWSRS